MLNAQLILEEPTFSTVNIVDTEVKNGVENVRFEAVLQTFDEPNRNKRVYTKEAGAAIFTQLKKLIKEGVAICEMDHPVGYNQEVQTKVMLKNVAFMIEDAWMDGNKLYGRCKTTSNTVGRDLAALIKDGVKVGFSLRAVGFNVEQADGFAKVKPPVMYISYDAVTKPSHEGARLIRLTEDQVHEILCSGDVCNLKAFKESLDLVRGISLNGLTDPRFNVKSGDIKPEIKKILESDDNLELEVDEVLKLL